MYYRNLRYRSLVLRCSCLHSYVSYYSVLSWIHVDNSSNCPRTTNSVSVFHYNYIVDPHVSPFDYPFLSWNQRWKDIAFPSFPKSVQCFGQIPLDVVWRLVKQFWVSVALLGPLSSDLLLVGTPLVIVPLTIAKILVRVSIFRLVLVLLYLARLRLQRSILQKCVSIGKVRICCVFQQFWQRQMI